MQIALLEEVRSEVRENAIKQNKINERNAELSAETNNLKVT